MLVWHAHSRMIDALAFSPDGRALALAGRHLACRLIDATDGRRLWSATSRHTFALSVAFARTGDVLCRDGGLSVRTAADGTERRKVGPWCRAFAPTPDGRSALAVNSLDLVRYDLATGAADAETALECGVVNRIAAAPDGRFVAAVGCQQFGLLADGKVIARAKERALSSGAFALAFSPNGRSVVFTAGRTLFVWDTLAAREVHRVQLEAKYFMDAAFTPDGLRLITVSKEGAARVWDAATWTCERTLEWDAGPLRAVAVSPDGTRAAVAGDSGRVVLWDLEM